MATRNGSLRRMKKRSLLTLAALGLLVIVSVSLAAVFDFNGLAIARPNLYAPERQALIEAEWQLSRAFAHEPAQMDEPSLVRQQVRTALDWLDKASRADPAHYRRIADLQRQVRALEAADQAARANTEQLARIYDQVVAELKALSTGHQNDVVGVGS